MDNNNEIINIDEAVYTIKDKTGHIHHTTSSKAGALKNYESLTKITTDPTTFTVYKNGEHFHSHYGDDKKFTKESFDEDQFIEEILALDEISKATLGAYVKKASQESLGQSIVYGATIGKADKRDEGKKSLHIAIKRMSGIQKAASKLTKEQRDKVNLALDLLEQMELEMEQENQKVISESGVSYEKDMDDNKPVIAHGVKGMKSTPFKKKFKTMKHYEDWSDKDEASDYEVHHLHQESYQISESTKAIVDAIIAGESSKVQELVNIAMQEKIESALEFKRAEVTGKMFNESAEELQETKTWAKLGYSSEHDYHKARYAHASGKKAPAGTSTTAMSFLASKAERDSGKKLHEELTLEDYSLEEIEEFMVSEEYEALDELSAKTLGGYLHKARAEIASKNKKYDNEVTNHPDVASKHEKLLRAQESKNRKRSNASYDRLERASDSYHSTLSKVETKTGHQNTNDETYKRNIGIGKALDKFKTGRYTKESAE